MLLFLQITLKSYQAGFLFGIILGVILGLIPLILGLIKKKRKYAMFGFLGSIIGSAILGLLLSIPIAGIFTWLILKKDEEPVDVKAVNENPSDVSVKNSDEL